MPSLLPPVGGAGLGKMGGPSSGGMGGNPHLQVTPQAVVRDLLEPGQYNSSTEKPYRVAAFSMGCFWGAQKLFSGIKGVKKVLTGYVEVLSDEERANGWKKIATSQEKKGVGRGFESGNGVNYLDFYYTYSYFNSFDTNGKAIKGPGGADGGPNRGNSSFSSKDCKETECETVLVFYEENDGYDAACPGSPGSPVLSDSGPSTADTTPLSSVNMRSPGSQSTAASGISPNCKATSTYSRLLQAFFQNHDSTKAAFRAKYSSNIWVVNPVDQRPLADSCIRKQAFKSAGTVVTKISPLLGFRLAIEKHQNYFGKQEMLKGKGASCGCPINAGLTNTGLSPLPIPGYKSKLPGLLLQDSCGSSRDTASNTGCPIGGGGCYTGGAGVGVSLTGNGRGSSLKSAAGQMMGRSPTKPTNLTAFFGEPLAIDPNRIGEPTMGVTSPY